MIKSLEALYRQEGDSTTMFYISFLDDEPRPDAAVIRALNDGADRIIVSTVFVSVSNHTAEGKHLVEKLDCEKRFGVKLVFADPMWDSETLAMAFVDKVNARVGATPKDQVGIALSVTVSRLSGMLNFRRRPLKRSNSGTILWKL
jgi:hypothetical protein